MAFMCRDSVTFYYYILAFTMDISCKRQVSETSSCFVQTYLIVAITNYECLRGVSICISSGDVDSRDCADRR